MSPPTVLTASTKNCTAMLTDGQVITITKWMRGPYDADDPATADRGIAGPDADGMWYAFTLTDDDRDGCGQIIH